MKFKTILLTALAVMTFASCSNDANEGGGKIDESQSAKLSIKFKEVQQLGGTRAFDTDARNEINDAMIFILDKGNVVLNHYLVADIDEDIQGTDLFEYETKVTANRVYVVSNLGSAASDYYTKLGLTSGQVDGKVVLSDLLAATAALSYLTASTDDLYMSGASTPLVWTPGNFASDGESLLAEAEVQLNLIGVKLNVTVNNNTKNYKDVVDGTAKGYLIKEVAVLYSAKENKIVPVISATAGLEYVNTFAVASTAANSYYHSGLTTWNTKESDETSGKFYTIGGVTALNKAWTSANLDDDNVGAAGGQAAQVFKNTFYALAGDPAAASKPMIVTVRAEHTGTAGVDKGEDKYYSVLLDVANDLPAAEVSVKNSREYNISIALNFDAKTGGGGDPDPEKPADKAFVTVEVTPGAWVPVTIPNKEWN